MMLARKKIFIASSSEALRVAEALQHNLDDRFNVDIWTQDVIRPSSFTLEQLESKARQYDFAVFVMSPDDRTVKRGIENWSTRDNVVFELGLFMGVLGRRRCFVLLPREDKPFVPSDLLGFTVVDYTHREPLCGALGAASTSIKAAIDQAIVSEEQTDQPVPTDYYNYRNLPNYTSEITNSCHRILIQSLRIRGFVEDHKVDGGRRLVQAIKRGTHIRVMLPDPSTKFVLHGRGDLSIASSLSLFSGEGWASESWQEAVDRAISFMESIKREVVAAGRTDLPMPEIRMHRSLVTTMVFAIDDVLYCGPYLAHSPSIKAPTFRVQATHPLFNRIICHFEDLWKDHRLTRSPEGQYAEK